MWSSPFLNLRKQLQSKLCVVDPSNRSETSTLISTCVTSCTCYYILCEAITNLIFAQQAKDTDMTVFFTHQNSLDSMVCFFRLSLSAMEMVDHSFELWKDQIMWIQSPQHLSWICLCTASNLWHLICYNNIKSWILLRTPWPLPQHNTPGIAQANQANFGALCNLITLETPTNPLAILLIKGLVLQRITNMHYSAKCTVSRHFYVPLSGLWWSRHDP